MTPQQRIDTWKLHDSQRGHFAFELYKHMAKNDKIYLISCDLGYGMFDAHREDFPDRFIQAGASEQAAMGIAVGLALQGKTPFIYSITTFLIYRPFEWIRNYLNEEGVAVRLIGSGRDKDYEIDGFSHDCSDIANCMLLLFRQINAWYPQDKAEIIGITETMIKSNRPSFISLRR